MFLSLRMLFGLRSAVLPKRKLISKQKKPGSPTPSATTAIQLHRKHLELQRHTTHSISCHISSVIDCAAFLGYLRLQVASSCSKIMLCYPHQLALFWRGEEAAPHHEKKMSHETLADLAQVLVSFENRGVSDIRDAAKKPQDGTKFEDGADEEGIGNAIEESISEESARQRMRHKYVNKDKAEDGPDRTDGTDEDQDGSSVTEESSEEPETSQLQKHKPWHKHKSHKHKKGGFHVYVEARFQFFGLFHISDPGVKWLLKG